MGLLDTKREMIIDHIALHQMAASDLHWEVRESDSNAQCSTRGYRTSNPWIDCAASSLERLREPCGKQRVSPTMRL
jgi:hypothetical protein